MPSRRLSPDTALEISLNGTARRLATGYAPMAEAVDELRTRAAGRSDVLAKAAGSHLGEYLAHPATTHPAIPYAAALLILAGADPALVGLTCDQVRKTAS